LFYYDSVNKLLTFNQSVYFEIIDENSVVLPTKCLYMKKMTKHTEMRNVV